MWPSIAAALLVAYQGWQGSQVVSSGLEPLIVSAHLVLALVIVSLLIYATQRAYYIEMGEKKEPGFFPKKLGTEVKILWIVAIVQILLGTQVRSKIEILQKIFPLTPDHSILATVGMEGYVHMGLGLLVIGFALHIVRMVLLHSDKVSFLAKQSIYAILILMIAQLVLGFVLIVVGMPELMRVFHLWVAALFIGTLLLLYTEVKRNIAGGENAG